MDKFVSNRRQILETAVEFKNGQVSRLGKSGIYHPEIHYSGKKTKWFDDSQLIRKGSKQCWHSTKQNSLTEK